MKFPLIVAAALVAGAAMAQDLPQPSPKGVVRQVVGLTNVEVVYNRPSVRGRKVFGELVPYGKVWRTGANLNTTIEFDAPVSIEGTELEAGKYSVFTIPGEGKWQIILNKNIELWGEGDRKAEQDVLTVEVAAVRGEFTETLTFDFAALQDDMAVLELRWENVRVPVTLKSNSTTLALANIEKALQDPNADFRVYNGSARFMVDRNIEVAKALVYAQKSVELDRRFWNMHTLALAYAANGNMEKAIATAEESKKLAVEAEYPAYVKLNDEKIALWSGKAAPAPAQGAGKGGAPTPARKR